MHNELMRRFDAHVTASPCAPAVVDVDRSLSYRQLAHASSVLAGRLVIAGAMVGDVVALASDRSIEWVVGMLATLRVGGVYLPLPPDLPRERRRLLMSEAGVRHMLRHPGVENDLGDAATVLDIELVANPSFNDAATPFVERPCDHGDRACVLFTSGTTGTPKGVIIRQSSIVRLVVETNYIELTPRDAVAFASNTAFDAVSFEVWGALLNGGRLVVVPTATLLSPSAFETAMRMHGVTALFLTTELFNRIARARPTAFKSLKWLLFGGEKANADCVRAVLESGGPPENLLHMYGPTECTTFTTCSRVVAVASDASTVPIGTPISGYQVHLLDERLHSVPDGQEGELFVAGTGLAEGYLNRPEQTDAAFVTLPIDGTATRVYRTGDRARRREDGQIEYIGRHDGQVKLRGFRIETAEIEAVLAGHPAVRDAVVLVYPGPGAAPRLGACLLLEGTSRSCDIDAIREFLLARLPAPMVPARLRGYEAFPLTASKKIDRQRLMSDLQQSDLGLEGDADGAFVPADHVEERMAAIWQGILGHQPRNTNENFFDVGGDSLQAVDVQLRIENEWRIALSPSTLIEAPTFGQLVEVVRRREAPDVRPVVWLTNGPRRPAMACMPGVYGHVFFFRNLVSVWPAGWGLCALPSRHLAPDCDRRLLSLEEIAQENLDRLDEDGSGSVEALAGYSFGGLVAYEMARRMVSRGKPPALILYDTAAEREQCRGLTAGQRLRILVRNIPYRLLPRGKRVPAWLFRAASANFVAVERYRPHPYPGDMLLVRSTSAGAPPGVNSETLGWDRLVQGTLTIRSVAVDHGDFFKPPHVSEVAAITGEYLRSWSACRP